METLDQGTMARVRNRDATAAFNRAIASGRLSDSTMSDRYAGDYMFMGTDAAGRDLFKHIDTREYIA